MKPRLAIANKQAAHDKWVCFACRWLTKLPRVDVRAVRRPSYVCPKCRKKMVCIGTAFRPPPGSDDEGWQVAERLVALGHRFASTQSRQSLPRTLKELDSWLAQQDDVWLPEKSVVLTESGELRFGRRVLAEGERVLTWHAGDWREGEVKSRGDGGRRLQRPLVVFRSFRSQAVTTTTRLRALKRVTL